MAIPISYNGGAELRCPVGGEILGLRYLWEKVMMYCYDCHRTYIYDSYLEKPIGSYLGNPGIPDNR